MAKSVEGFQYGEQYDTNGTKVKSGTYGKNTPFVTSDNTGILDYIIENFRVLYEGAVITKGDSVVIDKILRVNGDAYCKTMAKGDNSTKIANTAFVMAAIADVKTYSDSRYQTKGDYATNQAIQGFLSKTDAAAMYQPKGEYALKSDVATCLKTVDANASFVTKSDASRMYQPKGDFETVAHSNDNLRVAKEYADAIVSYGTNWIKFKGGKVIQWGTASAQSDKSWKATFPIAFKSSPAVLCGGTDWYSGETVNASYVTKYNEYSPNTKTEAVFVKKINNNISTAGGIFYIAIGDC